MSAWGWSETIGLVAGLLPAAGHAYAFKKAKQDRDAHRREREDDETGRGRAERLSEDSRRVDTKAVAA